jgi:Methyltransferase domain
MKLTGDDRVLDVGGYAKFWTELPEPVAQLDIINIDTDSKELTPVPGNTWMRQGFGNGCNLLFKDVSYDLVFSNSVIEHLHTWENQVSFAKEAQRVGKSIWVQTPAREFFIEPHYVGPFIHWVPATLRAKLIPWVTVFGWIERPTRERVEDMVAEIRLLTFKEFKSLFPDCDILREKFFGIFTKSYIAVRKDSGRRN